jgi:hypothetical protein
MRFLTAEEILENTIAYAQMSGYDGDNVLMDYLGRAFATAKVEQTELQRLRDEIREGETETGVSETGDVRPPG